MNNLDINSRIDTVTNNIRRIFREKGFHTEKEMATLLCERESVFVRYIWCGKREIPSYKKLKRWADTLNIDVSEFYISHPKEVWPYRPPKEKVKRKPGIGYRKALQIRAEIIKLIPYETIMANNGLNYIYQKYNNQ